jgi:hypothetical protein
MEIGFKSGVFGFWTSVGAGFSVTRFQTNFFPDLVHLKSIPKDEVVFPSFWQTTPFFTAAFAGLSESEKVIHSNAIIAMDFFSIG